MSPTRKPTSGPPMIPPSTAPIARVLAMEISDPETQVSAHNTEKRKDDVTGDTLGQAHGDVHERQKKARPAEEISDNEVDAGLGKQGDAQFQGLFEHKERHLREARFAPTTYRLSKASSQSRIEAGRLTIAARQTGAGVSQPMDPL